MSVDGKDILFPATTKKRLRYQYFSGGKWVPRSPRCYTDCHHYHSFWWS